MNETHFARIMIDRTFAATSDHDTLATHIRRALISHVPKPVAHILDVTWTAYADPQLGALRYPGLRDSEVLIEGEITYSASTNGIDYRKLLVKYMAEVLDCEGVSFVGHSGGFAIDMNRYTPDELAELGRIEQEAHERIP